MIIVNCFQPLTIITKSTILDVAAVLDPPLVIVIPVFNVVLISDKDENAINTGKHFVLFYFRSSRPEVFRKKRVLRNFAKFTGKYLCPGLFF